MEEDTLPVSAIVVAGGQILFGVWAIFEMMLAMLNPAERNLTLNLAVVFLFTGLGLLTRGSLARIIGRLLHTLIALLLPGCLGLVLLGIGMGSFSGGGIRTTMTLSSGPTALDALNFVFGVAVYAFNVWAIFVLGRADVIAACRRW